MSYFDGKVNIEKDKFSVVLTVLSTFGDNILPVAEKVLQLNKMNISVVLRIRHLKAEPVLQIYEASFSYCPQQSIFFTSRINVIPKIDPTTLDKLIQNSKIKVVISEEENNVTNLVNELTEKPTEAYEEMNLKEAQLFRMYYFRSISFFVFKWKEF